MKFEELVKNIVENKDAISSINLKSVEKIAQKIEEARKNNNTIFVAGNGGSSSTASHFVNDLMKATLDKNKNLIKAISLSDNVPLLTAISNDIDYSEIFRFPIESLSSEGDLFIAISASGNSKNLIDAVDYCKENEIFTVGLLGFDGGELNKKVDISNLIQTSSNNYELVENMHMIICHLISNYLK
tara:strand:- start:7373 stop:7930 length:558 start_codon:yes stop_codon:yes gene_type:complete